MKTYVYITQKTNSQTKRESIFAHISVKL